MDEYLDILGREKFIDEIYNIVEKLSDERKSCTFAVEGQWGIGKTFLIELLEKKLVNIQDEKSLNDRYLVFHYNCWKYDYYDEPSIAIIASMVEQIEKAEEVFGVDSDKYINAGWKKAKEIIGDISGEFIKNKIGINIVDVINDISEISKKNAKEKMAFDEMYGFRKTLEKTRKELNDLAEDKTVVIIVDELDRCLPSYMIKVLERLHHIFSDIDNIITILSIDSKQLEESVLKIYGNNTRVDDYLRKFIDFTLILDSGTIDDKFKEKYKSYFDKFAICNMDDIYQFQDLFVKLFSTVDIRTQEKLIKKAETIHGLVNDLEKPNIALLGFELMCVLYSFKYNGSELRWIPDINKATYSGLEERIGKQGVQYLQKIEKSVGENNKVTLMGKGEYRLVKNVFVDKLFWIFSSIYYEFDNNTCNNYLINEEILNGEEQVAKKYYDLIRIMK